MSIAAALAATLRRPTATVYLNGTRWDDWLSLSRSQSYGDGIGGGEASGRSLPSGVAVGTPIRWAWGYAGYGEIAGFDGVVTEITDAAYPQRTVLRLADPLWKASVQRKDIATSPLNSIAASTAITQILSAAGITRLSIPALAASGSAWSGGEWTLGVLTPVAFGNTTALAAAQQIANTLGYWLYADASGVVRATLMERRPSGSPTRTLAWGQDFLWAGTPSRRRGDTLKNRVVVKGANTGVQGAQIQDAWQTGAADRVLELTFDLIEYVNESEAGLASCTAVAKQKLALWSRDPNLIEIPRLKADPRLAVGQTLAVQCALLGYGSPKAFFLYALSTTLNRMTGEFVQQLTLDGGLGDTGYTTIPAPSASFAYRLVAETLNGAGITEIFLDGSGATSFGGEITAWAWSTSTSTYSGTPSTASGVKALFVYPAAATTAAITLTVTDTSSKTGALTQTITLAGDATMARATRTISVALGSAWGVTPDGGATWNVEASGDSTLVPEIGGAQLLSTAATGSTGLRGTADALGSASTALASLGGAITALSATEGYPLRVWAAVGATVHQSLDGGATFTTWGTLPASVVGILEDPAVLSSVFFLAGADFYHGTAVYYAGPAGATARQMVRGHSGATTWICYTGSFIGSPLQRVEGPVSVTFPVVSPAVTEIRAIALSPDELSLYAWDAQGRGWTMSAADGLGVAAHATSLASGETAMHALHDPDDSIVYLATFGATQGNVYKYWPLADRQGIFYQPAAGRQAHRIGLSPAPAPPPGSLLVGTWGVTGANDGIWLHKTTAWTKVAPPVAGWYWRQIAISPFSDNDWIVWGNSSAAGNLAISGTTVRSTDGSHSPIWRTADGGTTWSEIALTIPSGASPSAAIQYIIWSTVGGWTIVGCVGYGVTGYFNPMTQIAWRSGGYVRGTLLWGQAYAPSGADVGVDGDTLVAMGYRQYSPSQGICVLSGSGVWSSWIQVDLFMIVSACPGTRAAWSVNPTSATLWRSADYRSSPFASAGTSIISVVGNPDGSCYAVAGTGTTGASISKITSGGVSTTVYTLPTGKFTAALLGNAQRTSLAAMSHALGFVYYDGAAWSVIAYPTGLDSANFGQLALMNGVTS